MNAPDSTAPNRKCTWRMGCEEPEQILPGGLMHRMSGHHVAGWFVLPIATMLMGCSSSGTKESFGDRLRIHTTEYVELVPPHDAGVSSVDANILALAAVDLAQVTGEGRGALNPRCRVTTPQGDCDRCPEHACLQVLVPRSDSEPEWRSFCDAGNVREEAWIACRCAGGSERSCSAAAMDTERALFIVANVFGGEVPQIGQRYRDSNGLRQVIRDEQQQWLALRVAAPMAMRCDAPDPETAERHYAACAQGMRMRH